VRCRFTCNWCDDASLRARLLRTFFKPADMELVVDGSYDILIAINQDSMLDRIPEYRPETTYCFTMEPAWSAALEFDYRSFKRIYTHVEGRWPNAVNIPTMLPYHLIESKEDLIQFKPIKTKKLSFVVSTKRGVGLYGFRLALALKLLKTSLDFDLYGYGWPSGVDLRIKGPVTSKSVALAGYDYSICIENSREVNYVSEKIVDCFLTGTIPIYLGCPNIEEIYDSRSYHCIDATDPVSSIESILNGSACKQPYIARDEFFDKYDLLKFVAAHIK
jgi:hypothetical protein